MNSTSTSDPILILDRVNLTFRTDMYRPWTWREAFSRIQSNAFSGLSHQPDRLHVAKDISFTVRSGERVGILGVNGTGKTSLCRCISGTYKPTSGRILIRGQLRSVFDTGIAIQPELTGRENARLLFEFMYPEASDKEALIEEALEFSELGEFADAPFRIYSNGMQARLYLSVISRRPADLFILDEVFDGADEFFRKKIEAQMIRIIEQSGAVIFVSHVADQIKNVCNRVIVLEDGRIVFDGGIEEGIARYRNAGEN